MECISERKVHLYWQKWQINQYLLCLFTNLAPLLRGRLERAVFTRDTVNRLLGNSALHRRTSNVLITKDLRVKAPITLGTYFEGLPAYSRVLQIFEKPAENVQNRLRPLCTLIYAYCVRIYAYMYVLYVSIRI